MSKHYVKSAAFVCAILMATLVGGRVAEAGWASGGGTRVRPAPAQGEEEVETLAFNAHDLSEGVAQGEIHFRVKTDGKLRFQSQLKVDSMLFVADDLVLIGGPVAHDTDPDFVGTTAFFVVRDNGEGSGGLPDERSDLFYSKLFGIEFSYESVILAIENGLFGPGGSVTPIDTGNFQVNP